MKIVIDNNILFSIMNPKSASAYLFSSFRTKFFAPEFIMFELEKYKEICLFKSGLSQHEFEIWKEEIMKSIKLFKTSEYLEFLPIAINNLEDSKDSPYLALALAIDALIWSNDSKLKNQNLSKVYNTQELVHMFIKNDI
jgi:predicted nucleic acid-binding protein